MCFQYVWNPKVRFVNLIDRYKRSYVWSIHFIDDINRKPFSIAVHKKSMLLLFVSHETGLIRLKNNDLFQWSVAPFVALSVASSGVCFLVWFFQKLKHTPPIMMISYTAAADDDTSYFYFSKPLLIPIWSILRIQSPSYNRIYLEYDCGLTQMFLTITEICKKLWKYAESRKKIFGILDQDSWW